MQRRDMQSESGPEAVAVVGGGAWGTALALTALRAGRRVSLWAREPEVVEAIERRRENPVFLPGVALPESLIASDDLAEVCVGAEAALLVVPSQFLRAVAEQVETVLPRGVPAIVCAKGIERETGLLMTQVVEQAMPGRPLAVLSGPTFAAEVAADQPTAVTLATAENDEETLATQLAAALSTPTFRIYVSHDPVGVEVGGAVKNVIASPAASPRAWASAPTPARR